jgi:hypothetical protein
VPGGEFADDRRIRHTSSLREIGGSASKDAENGLRVRIHRILGGVDRGRYTGPLTGGFAVGWRAIVDSAAVPYSAQSAAFFTGHAFDRA